MIIYILLVTNQTFYLEHTFFFFVYFFLFIYTIIKNGINTGMLIQIQLKENVRNI